MSAIREQSQARCTRIFGLSRGVVKRLVALGAKFLPWFDHEKKIAGRDLILTQFYSSHGLISPGISRKACTRRGG